MPAVSENNKDSSGWLERGPEGELGQASPEVSRVAADISKKDAKDFASTKHKGLPEKKMKRKITSILYMHHTLRWMSFMPTKNRWMKRDMTECAIVNLRNMYFGL